MVVKLSRSLCQACLP